jgi:hypothetical protein
LCFDPLKAAFGFLVQVISRYLGPCTFSESRSSGYQIWKIEAGRKPGPQVCRSGSCLHLSLPMRHFLDSTLQN